MKKYKNEQGAALVLTMFIITILLLFVSAQLFQVTNTRKQVSTMEKKIMSEHMAEMGIDYYRALIEHIEQDPNKPIEDYVNKIRGIASDKLKQQITSPNDSANRSYEIEVKEVIDDKDEVLIKFISIGKAYGTQKKIESSITISVIVN